jgi:hypothetical protein
MKNILKSKYFLLLFLVFFFVLSPSNASADEYQDCAWGVATTWSICDAGWTAVDSNCSGDKPAGQACCCEKKKNPDTGEWETPEDNVYDPLAPLRDVTLGSFIDSLVKGIAKIISKIFIASLALLVGIGAFIAAAMSALAIHVFDTILGALINVPIIGAEVVTSMWTFVRDFANLFFILFFVIIGLATIRKIESYKFQKTLPLLIIMALLVNFSLVLVGLVVDMGNILTGLFLDGVANKGGGWSGVLGLGSEYILGIGKILTLDVDLGELWAIGLGYVSYGVVLVFFFFVICCVFWVTIFIFFWRIAILWTLAILSPLAFVSYIFVSTRQAIWSRWFKALVQWSFIAVPILFFMVLAFAVVTTVPSSIEAIQTSLGADPSCVPDMENPDSLKDPTGSGFQCFIINLVSTMVPPIIALIMMILGITISMTFAPEGAQSAVDASHKAGSWAGKTVRRSTPGQATERFVRQRLEQTPLRGLVGGRGAWTRSTIAEKERQRKLMEPLSWDERRQMVNDHTFDRTTRDGIAAAFTDMSTGANRPIDEALFRALEARAERGGADMGKARAQNPTYRIADDPSFNEALDRMRSVGDFSGLTSEAFINPTGDPRIQTRIVQLLERMTRLSEQQLRKVAENIDPETRRAAVNTMNTHNAAWRGQATAAGRTAADINESEAHFNDHFGT